MIKNELYSRINSHNKNKTKIELNLSYHGKRSNLKEAGGINALVIAKKTDLANLKTKC